MASLEQLRKKLKSVELTEQLTNAMKTVSSAKYAKISRIFLNYKPYVDELEKLSEYCGNSQFAEKGNQTEITQDCYVIIGHNRGFCGGYNTELNNFAYNILKDNLNNIIIVCGKKSISYFEEKKFTNLEKFILPDVPDFNSCQPIMDCVINLFLNSSVGSVKIIYQSPINTMIQKPTIIDFLPLKHKGSQGNSDNILMLPDKDTIINDLELKIIKSKFYKTILEAAQGAQSATLLAMRTAVDHATQTKELLENQIHKKRQSAVTSGVIETSSSMTFEEA